MNRGRYLELAYYGRRCFVCDGIGPCGHREPAVEFAYVEAGEAVPGEASLRRPPAREIARVLQAASGE